MEIKIARNTPFMKIKLGIRKDSVQPLFSRKHREKVHHHLKSYKTFLGSNPQELYHSVAFS